MSTENPWKVLNSEKIYDNNWISLTEHQVLNPSGGEGIYGEVHFKNIAIGILPLDADLNTWLVGQYRFPIKEYSWEIVEGGGVLNADPIESAKRELAEETGLTAKRYTEIQRMHLSNSVSDELAIIYLAQDLQLGESSPEETEELIVRKLPFEEAYLMVMNGVITDSISVAAILKTKILLQQGKI
ncbi:NUDIX domain-containing protein [Pedobacter sp. LMG 31464]|uniref:GDP-mannose pyrophosphatase n=1 Tax=Pedobacter planticolens TaxID=2679964 RepID=A0A923IVZ6_9SPHI|nr:NUDIX hydrolase [Pedobacter planticolens]MBB2146566.1 NUDIX domain-containing protein [Pedobacter planticolens]